MNREAFKEWLVSNGGTNPKLVNDTVSRAKRVEEAFQAVIPGFSFEGEYAKDKGKELCEKISRRGVSIKEAVALPLGTNQMDSIASATKKYIKFLESTMR